MTEQTMLQPGELDRSFKGEQEEIALFMDCAFLCYERYDYERALRLYMGAQILDPANVDIHSAIGTTLMQLERYDDAVTWLSRAMELCPSEECPYVHVAEMLIKQGKPAEARKLLANAQPLVDEGDNAALQERLQALMDITDAILAEQPAD